MQLSIDGLNLLPILIFITALIIIIITGIIMLLLRKRSVKGSYTLATTSEQLKAATAK